MLMSLSYYLLYNGDCPPARILFLLKVRIAIGGLETFPIFFVLFMFLNMHLLLGMGGRHISLQGRDSIMISDEG